MNIIWKLTINNLKKNKKRTIMTIVGVMLSTALICAVAGLLTSARSTLIDYAKTDVGDYHVTFYDVPNQLAAYLEDNAQTQETFSIQPIGYAVNEGSQIPETPYHFILAMPETVFSRMGVHVLDGRLPETKDELVISKSLIAVGGCPAIGETITLEIGVRKTDDEERPGQWTDLAPGEVLTQTIFRTFTVVGIVEPMDILVEPYSAPGITALTVSEPGDTLIPEGYQEVSDINVILKNPREYEAICDQMEETLYEEMQKADIGSDLHLSVNRELLRFQGGFSDSTWGMLTLIGIIVVIIIMGTSIFVIRNSFAISVAEKTRMYGMLSGIGGTPSQLQQSVLNEGIVVGGIGIPLGMGFGTAAVAVLMRILNVLLSDMAEHLVFRFSMPPLAYAVSFLLSAATIYFSCLFPAIRAGRIPPMEAIRGNREMTWNNKTMHTSRIIHRLFGIGGVIAAKNLKRSRRKYRTTIISLVVSIATFLSLASFVEEMKRTAGMVYTDYGYNLRVYLPDNADPQRLVQGAGLEDGTWASTRFLDAKADLTRYGTAFAIAEHAEILDNMAATGYYDEQWDSYDLADLTVVAFNRTYFARFLESLGISGNVETAAVLGDDWIDYGDDGVMTLRRYYTLRDGDTMELSFPYKDGIGNKVTDEETLSVTISKVSQTRPAGFEGSFSTGGYLFLCEDQLPPSLLKRAITGSIYLNAEHPDSVEKALNTAISDDPSLYGAGVENITKIRVEERNLLLTMEIFLYGLISVITLIGVTNIFNTIHTNVLLRTREFAMLRSIGMTGREFRRMIRLESFLYGMKALLIGIPLGLAGSLLIYRAFSTKLSLGYRFPLLAALLCVIVVFLIVFWTMSYSVKAVRRANIIDAIREENL